jgi:acyl-coenzyme A synthetase/AMP-(fatty) acid ligase
MEHIYGVEENDVWWTASDIGWVVRFFETVESVLSVIAISLVRQQSLQYWARLVLRPWLLSLFTGTTFRANHNSNSL